MIAQGMAVLYLQKPPNPVDFLAKWLINYSKGEKMAALRVEESEKIIDLRSQKPVEKSMEGKETDTRAKEVIEKEQRKMDFTGKLELSSDLAD